jgi:hypothetical protein
MSLPLAGQALMESPQIADALARHRSGIGVELGNRKTNLLQHLPNYQLRFHSYHRI